MAYEKKTVQEYIAETDDKTVEGFNDNQETRIKAGFDNITTDSIQVGTGGIQSDGKIIDKNGDEVLASGIEPSATFFKRGEALNANLGEDSLGNSGWYRMTGGSINAPHEYGTLIHFDRDIVTKAQIFIQVNDGAMYSRSRGSNGVWSTWRAVT